MGNQVSDDYEMQSGAYKADESKHKYYLQAIQAECYVIQKMGKQYLQLDGFS